MGLHHMGCDGNVCETDHGSKPFVANIMCAAQRNQNFRTAFWTGCHLQMTLMCIPPCGEIGMEMHPDMDQFIRIEEGQAIVSMGDCREKVDFRCCVGKDDAIFVPSGTWHNVCNTRNCPLKLTSFYAPPQHPRGTIHHTKADAAHEE